jgi:hypothetical protein
MSDDFMTRLGQSDKNLLGEERPIEQVVDDFSLYGLGKRVEALTQFDEHLRTMGDVGRGESEIREYARLMRLRRAIDKAHHDLRKVGR